MLQEPGTSPYDLNFDLLGYRVRVTWGFWVVALVLGWGWSGYVAGQLSRVHEMDSPGAPVILLIWIAAVFLSILVHELGHSIAMSYYGTSSHIVLYHFGGLAISNFGAWNGARQRNIGPREQIVISAAGPAFQLGLAALVAALGYALKIRMDLWGYTLGTTEFPASASVYAVFNAILYPSVLWALINLAPLLPLDGGQITKNALMLSNVQRPTHVAHVISIGTGVLLGLFFMQRGNPFAGLMFFMFAANNWQAMQYGGGGF